MASPVHLQARSAAQVLHDSPSIDSAASWAAPSVGLLKMKLLQHSSASLCVVTYFYFSWVNISDETVVLRAGVWASQMAQGYRIHLPANAGDAGDRFSPWVGKILWRRK